jgi:diguanylate cyclase (GGDEF)-like protein
MIEDPGGRDSKSTLGQGATKTSTRIESRPRPRAASSTDLQIPALPDQDAYRRKRAGGDLYGRSLIGPLFYFLGCLVTAGVGGFFHPLRWVAWLPATLFAALFFLRRLNRPPTDFADAEISGRWRVRHWALIHGGCALWSVVFVYVGLVESEYRLPLTISVMCSVAFGAALAQAFSMERLQTTLTLVILFLPALCVFVFVNPVLRPVALTIVLYGLYLLSSLRRLAREYDTQIQTEYALMVSRTEVERLTRLDMLTGLANRREYERAFPLAWHQAARHRGELALLVFDIDHFKSLNDRHGHLAGDACLSHFAGLLKGHFRRDIDLLARIGGEEFVAVLPGSKANDALDMAERFRATLADSPCPWEGQTLEMTVSIGAGSANWSMDRNPSATFARVDLACYEAKTRGRNRVALAADDPPAS